MSEERPAADAAGPDPQADALTNEQLEDAITTLAAHLNAATARLLALIGELDRRQGWGHWGIRSCAHWLNWKCGIGLNAAREKVRVARALEALPRVRAAFAAGELSYSKVRAMTRVADADNEDYLLMIARHGTAMHLERLVRGYRRCVERDRAAANAAHAGRRLYWYSDDDGMLVVHGRLPAEVGALVVQALEAAQEALRETGAAAPPIRPPGVEWQVRAGADPLPGGASAVTPVPAGPGADPAPRDPSAVTSPPGLAGADPSAVTSPPGQAGADPSAVTSPPGLAGADPSAVTCEPDPDEAPLAARRADALAHMAEQFLAGGDGCTPARLAERYQVQIHVDPDTLRTGADSGRCHLEDGPALAADTARRLACDTAVVRLPAGAGIDPLDVGRRTRTIPPALRHALQARDRGCRFPGCTHRHWVDAHHIRHWADGGATRLGNLALLCRRHHRLVHEGGFRLECRDDGKLLFFRPDGRLIEPVPAPPVPGSSVEAINRAAGLDVTAVTCVPRWDGEDMDLGMAVDGLLQCQRRRRPPDGGEAPQATAPG